MNIVRAGLDAFAKLVGVDSGHAEDALHSERAAKHVLNRRALIGTLGAMAAGVVMPLPMKRKPYEPPWIRSGYGKFILYVDGKRVGDVSRLHFEFDETVKIEAEKLVTI